MTRICHKGKLTAGVVCLVMLSGLITEHAASEEEDVFSDVAGGYWAEPEIEDMAERGYVSGYPDGTFKPERDINRGQAAAMLVSALDLPVNQNAASSFQDLGPDSYFTPYSEAVHEAGIMTGRKNNTEFAPSMKLTREQMASLLTAAYDLIPFEDKNVEVQDLEQAHDSHRENIATLDQYFITRTENGIFRPKEHVSRAQFTVFMERAITADTSLWRRVTEMELVDENTVDVHLNKRIEASEIEAADFSLTPRNVDTNPPGTVPEEPEIHDIEVSHNTENPAEWTTVRLTTSTLDLTFDYSLGIHNRRAYMP
ncbi:S-layer homology domain-containing protein [Salibacterium lacus]|uniref:S-layer homology domain-containing protein n=1 Tax=Salibacterium lacus TaxID=1898109 RepID=A0ABW5T540_9BACI